MAKRLPTHICKTTINGKGYTDTVLQGNIGPHKYEVRKRVESFLYDPLTGENLHGGTREETTYEVRRNKGINVWELVTSNRKQEVIDAFRLSTKF